MNNKLFFIVLILITGSLFFQEVSIIGYTVYKVGNSFESGGKTITIKRISSSNVVVDVSGIKNIVSVGEYKIINGIKVEVINIFYTEEIESRNVELSINILDAGSCGDGECKAGETSETCCKDCGCPIDYTCEEGECVFSKPSECRKHEDCDDSDSKTIDLCLKTYPRVCKNYRMPDNAIVKEEVNETGIIEKGDEDTMKEERGFFSKVIIFFKILFGS